MGDGNISFEAEKVIMGGGEFKSADVDSAIRDNRSFWGKLASRDTGAARNYDGVLKMMEDLRTESLRDKNSPGVLDKNEQASIRSLMGELQSSRTKAEAAKVV